MKMDYLLELNKKCKNYIKRGENCDDNCCNRLNRKPTLKTGNIQHQVIKFERI